MQSSRVVTPGDLDRPIRTALPWLASGAAGLARLGIATPREALWYLPFRYDDFSELRTLGELMADEKQSARVRVEGIRIEPGFARRPQRVIAQLSDTTGSAEAIWFGRRYVERRLREGDVVAGFTVLDVPGHSRGHVAYWRESDRVLVLGDVLNNIDVVTGRRGLREPKWFFTPDPERNRESIRRVAALGPDLVCFGHGPPLRDPAALAEFAAGLPA
jgi:glyoxylase-like metal-dependent hydrolase (beta-lactamase superfamily II)